ncbi:hypothetical protein [Streptomyces sp. NPDC002640]
MTTYGLGPTKLYARSERLLHGKGMESAIGRGEAEDWIGLDSEVKWVTYKALHPSGRSTSWTRVGFLAVPQQEIADWERAPSWQEDGTGAGAPSWSLPPTESEIALCLSHADPRLRAAALTLDARGALPDSVMPLVLIRSADTDERVRTLARAVLDHLLADADDTQLRRLAPLAALVGEARRYRDWARRNVLDRIGGLPDEALAHLLTSHRRESRRCALDAAGAYGNLAPARIWALAEQDPDEAVRGLAVATALRLALDSGQQTAVDDARSRFLAHLDDERAYGLRLRTFATAVASDFLRIDDLATLATTHRYRKIRWHACSAVLAHPRGDTVLDRLLTARDTRVRAAAVDRLRLAGRGDELPRYLTDLSGRVRAAACREVRAAGGDPHAHYLALCGDPATVVPTAVLGLAEQGRPEDTALLRPLLRHPHAGVRDRALSALRMLDALPDDALPPFADDPDPGVRGTALSALGRTPCLLRELRDSPREDVRAHVEILLEYNQTYRRGACRCCPPPPPPRRSRLTRILSGPRPEPWQPSMTRPASYDAARPGTGASLPAWARPPR